MDFPPEVITGRRKSLGPTTSGATVGTEIRKRVDVLKDKFVTTQFALMTGIDNFADFQKFASSTEAKADYAGVAFDFALKQILDNSAKAISKSIKPLDPIYKFTFGLVEKLEAESKRVAKAESEVLVRDFIVSYRTTVTNVFKERIELAPTVETELNEAYQQVAAESPDLAKPSASTGPEPGRDIAVAGAPAEFLSELERVVNSFAVPTPAGCLEAITEAWVLKAEGTLKSRGGGDIYVDGQIELDAKIYKDGEKWTIKELPSTGVLAAPRADKTVDALKQVFKDTGKTTNDLQILKVLKIDVEDEVTWFNDHYYAYVNFRSPGDAYLANFTPSPVNSDTVPNARAYAIRAFELVFADPGKLGVKELSAGKEGKAF
jgi:hypothetical protein